MSRQLNTKQRAFIAAVQTGIPATQAAIQAGYSSKSAKTTAHYLMHECEAVKTELGRTQSDLAKRANYNGDKALSELQEAIVFAKATKNANAYVRAIELRAKLCGLLTEKVDMNFTSISIDAALAEARARLARPAGELPRIIDGEAVDVTNATSPDIFS